MRAVVLSILIGIVAMGLPVGAPAEARPDASCCSGKKVPVYCCGVSGGCGHCTMEKKRPEESAADASTGPVLRVAFCGGADRSSAVPFSAPEYTLPDTCFSAPPAIGSDASWSDPRDPESVTSSLESPPPLSA